MELWEAAQWGQAAVRPCGRTRARRTESAMSLERSLLIGAARRRLLQHAIRKHKVLSPPAQPLPPHLDRSRRMVEKFCHRASRPSVAQSSSSVSFFTAEQQRKLKFS